MTTWQRVLIGGGIGLMGVALYFVTRLWMETARKVTTGDVVGAVALCLIGMTLAGLGDRVLEPVTVAAWLRWTVIGVAFATGIACYVVVQRARVLSDSQLIAVYAVGLFLAFLAIRMFIAEVFPD